MDEDNSSSAKTPRPQVQDGEPKTPMPDMVLAALRGSVPWHEEHGRPYSASVDRDAIAEIERLTRERDGERDARENCQRALRAKDEAMGVLFKRLESAGVDVSDLLP